MLLAFAGVSGIGKSYYKNKLVEKLGFKKIKIITTREMRIGEKNNDDKIFVRHHDLQNLLVKNKIDNDFELIGITIDYIK